MIKTIVLPAGTKIDCSFEKTQYDLQRLVDTDFKKFVRGTSPKYSYIDKLEYIDLIRKRINETTDFETTFKQVAGEWAYEEKFGDGDGEMLDLAEPELLEQTFARGSAPLNTIHGVGQSHSDQLAFKHIVYIIVRAVMESNTQPHDTPKWESIE